MKETTCFNKTNHNVYCSLVKCLVPARTQFSVDIIHGNVLATTAGCETTAGCVVHERTKLCT